MTEEYYHTSSGYGFEICYWDLPGIADRLGYLCGERGFDANEFGAWLVERYPGLIYDTCGEFSINGERYLIIGSSMLREKSWQYVTGGRFRKFAVEEVTCEDDQQLRKLFEIVYRRKPGPKDIGWYMSATMY